ncbi:hypothetical protein HYY69_06025 [Candidatus Woesearchaeota archaeon]|nr:hypothetical protein [Candidatus Woesearchaeota archaeon]
MKQIGLGLGVSKGRVQGRACVIQQPSDFSKFVEGMILVTHLTDPTMVPLMNKAAGIVCNIGGLTSHPSIVSREMGIPCIVSAKCVETGKQVTEIIQHNDLIQICGEKGEIHLLER